MSEINDAARSPWKDDEKLLDVNETTLASRITFLQEQLVKASQALRSEIDPTLSDQNLTEDNLNSGWFVILFMMHQSKTFRMKDLIECCIGCLRKVVVTSLGF